MSEFTTGISQEFYEYRITKKDNNEDVRHVRFPTDFDNEDWLAMVSANFNVEKRIMVISATEWVRV